MCISVCVCVFLTLILLFQTRALISNYEYSSLNFRYCFFLFPLCYSHINLFLSPSPLCMNVSAQHSFNISPHSVFPIRCSHLILCHFTAAAYIIPTFVVSVWAFPIIRAEVWTKVVCLSFRFQFILIIAFIHRYDLVFVSEWVWVSF